MAGMILFLELINCSFFAGVIQFMQGRMFMKKTPFKEDNEDSMRAGLAWSERLGLMLVLSLLGSRKCLVQAPIEQTRVVQATITS